MVLVWLPCRVHADEQVLLGRTCGAGGQGRGSGTNRPHFAAPLETVHCTVPRRAALRSRPPAVVAHAKVPRCMLAGRPGTPRPALTLGHLLPQALPMEFGLNLCHTRLDRRASRSCCRQGHLLLPARLAVGPCRDDRDFSKTHDELQDVLHEARLLRHTVARVVHQLHPAAHTGTDCIRQQRSKPMNEAPSVKRLDFLRWLHQPPVLRVCAPTSRTCPVPESTG